MSISMCMKLLAVLLLSAVSAGTLASGDLATWVIGRAYDSAGEQHLYDENYRCDGQRLRCEIEYRTPAGELIASKSLDYSYGAYTPAVLMQDHVHDRRYEVEGMIERAADDDIVIDAGFDNFVRSRWQALSSGDSVTFPFRSVTAPGAFQMRARTIPCADQHLCLDVRPGGWLIGMLVEPIALQYDRSSRRLLRFQGLGNLRDRDGRTMNVDIQYRYPEPDVEANAELEAELGSGPDAEQTRTLASR